MKQINRMVKKAEALMEQLNEAILEYNAKKKEMEALKEVVDKRNKEIKDMMEFGRLTEYPVGDIIVTRQVSQRREFIEDKLLETVRPYNIPGLIKTKEYVDMDVLENAIYHGKVDAATLSECQTIKEIVSLRIKRREE